MSNIKLNGEKLKQGLDRMAKKLDAYQARLKAAAGKKPTAGARYRIVRGRLTLVKAGDA
ncbi:MAG TPA: hypothetical protein PLX97_07935 [Gemmatales bacterium]|nr:hypothetical protein [Gemmatales bacterium]